MEVISGKMLEILDDMDLLLSTRKEFIREFGITLEQSQLF